MSDLENDFNLEDLEKMSKEGLEHFDNDDALASIEADAVNKIEKRLVSAEDLEKVQSDAKSEIWKLLLVLAIVLGLCFLLFSMLGTGGDQEQKLFASNYDSPPFLLSNTERNANSDSAKISSIKNLYSKKDYAACLNVIEANDAFALREYPDLALYKGICLLEEGRAKEASEILKNPSIDIEDVRLWYLAMAHLSAGEKEACIQVLESLTNLESNYKNDAAKSLLQQLQK